MTKLSSTLRDASEESKIWANLREAIAHSSAFQGWQREQNDPSFNSQPLDKQVRRYLRETLETLAY